MTQIFTGTGLGTQGSSIGQLGSYGPKGSARLGQGGDSVYVNGVNGNLVVKQSDGFMSGLGLGMDVFQTYNSKGEGANLWRFNLETSLIFEGTPNSFGSSVTRIDEDGHKSRFIFDVNKNSYTAEDKSTTKLIFSKGEWQYQDKATRCNYNAQGQLTSLSDKNGHMLRLSYENGSLSQIIDTHGKQRVTWIFKKGLIQDVTFVSDNKTIHHLHYEYDSHNRIAKVSRDLDSRKIYWISYSYHGETNLISDINQSDGTKLHIDYDEQSRVKRIVDGEGRSSTYQYLSDRTIITNDLGQSWTYIYDDEAKLIGIDGPDEYHIRYYYTNKHLTSVTQGKQRWNFSYNEAGDCIRTESPSGEVVFRTFNDEHYVLSETRYKTFDENHHPSQPQTNRYVYDEFNHLRFEIHSNGTVTEHRYDSEGQCISSRCYLKATFDINSLNSEDAVTLDVMIIWSQKQKQQEVSLKTYTYDWRGNVTEEFIYNLIDAEGRGIVTKDTLKSFSRYDASGLLIEKSSINDKGLATTYYFYDDLGRLTRTVDNQKHSSMIEYDDTHHRMIKTDANGLQTISIFDQSGLHLCTQKLDANHQYGTTTYKYDAASRLISETDVLGKTRYFFYDAQGRILGKLDTAGQLTEYQYDLEGHCVKTQIYFNHVTLQSTKSEYPTWDLIKPKSDHRDRISQVIYDEYQQIAYEINADGSFIGYKYDAQGRVVTKTAYALRLDKFIPENSLQLNDVIVKKSNKDRALNYYYDSEGRVEAVINGEGAATSYQYDAQGHLINSHQFKNRVSTISGDWAIDMPKTHPEDLISYSLYNPAGLKIADIDAEGYLIEYRYDNNGLLIERIAYYTSSSPQVINSSTTIASLIPKLSNNDHHTVYRYNDLNQLIEERSQSGLIITYTYNEMGLIASKTSSDVKTQESRQQIYRYDAMGRMIQRLDERGASLLEQGTETVETIWQQHSIKYTYNNAGLITSKTNALNQTTRYFYNDKGLITFTLSPDGGVTEQRYDAFSQIETTIKYHAQWRGKTDISETQLKLDMKALADSRFDEATYFEYDSLGLIIGTRCGTGSNLRTTYNAFGEVEETRQSIGLNHDRIKTFEYDRRGLIRKLTEDLGGVNKTSETQYDSFGRTERTFDARHYETAYQLNKRGEVTLITSPQNNIKLMTYDAFGRITKVKDKQEVLYLYDDATNTITIEHPLHNKKNQTSSFIVTEFNAFGDKVKFIDGNKNMTTFNYDSKGQLTRIDGPEQSHTQYRYDDEGRLIFEQKGKNYKVSYSYDAVGRELCKSIDPEGINVITRITYDGIGRQLTINDAGRLTEFTYDDQGNLIKKCVDPHNLNLITEYNYTDAGLLARQIIHNANGQNKITEYRWDALGRCISTIVDPEGLALVCLKEYDVNDNLITQIDAKGQRTQFVFDGDNNLRYQIDARGAVTEHCYDAQGNEIKTIKYANQISSLKQYNESTILSALKSSVDDHYQFYAYDNQSRRTMSYNGLGFATEFAYDANDNIVVQILHHTACSVEKLKAGIYETPEADLETRKINYAFDGLNNKRFQIIKDQTVEYRFDDSGQLIEQIRYAYPLNPTKLKNKFTIESIENALTRSSSDQKTYYAYDAVGRLQAQATPEGYVTNYQYDDAGNLIRTIRHAIQMDGDFFNKEDWSTQIPINVKDRTTHAVFDAAGREVYRISATGHVVSRTYDEVGNVLTEKVFAKSILLDNYSLEKLDEFIKFNTPTYQSTRYEYDNNSRLKKKTDALNQMTSYTYDENNNVASKINAANSCWTYTYDECNQLIETSSPKLKVSRYQNDKLTEELRSIKTKNIYDSFGNLISTIRDSEGIKQTIEYVYDSVNQKITTIHPNVFVNNATKSISKERQEELKTLTETLVYNAFGEVVSSIDKAGHSSYWVYDRNGTLRYSINARNAVTQYKYDALNNLKEKTTHLVPLKLAEGAEYNIYTISDVLQYDNHDRVETYEYDKEGHLIQTQKSKVLQYNSHNGFYDKLIPTTKTTYNAFGEIIQIDVQINENQWATTRSYYDLEGLKCAQIDAEGYLTTYEYDDYCLLECEIQFNDRSPQFSADEFKKPQPNSKDRTVVFNYDALGQLKIKTLKNVSYNQLTGNGGQYKSIVGDLTSSYSYDALGNLVSTTDALGHTVYSYYNEIGQLIGKVGVQNKSGRSATTYSYDALGKLVETHQWANGVKMADEHQFVLSGESSKDIITQESYDSEGHLIQQTDGTGHKIFYSYDANGNIARTWQVIQRNGKTPLIQDKRFLYDAENHLIQTGTIKPTGVMATDDAVYNIFGEIVAKGTNSVFNTHIDYDNLGRVWRSNTSGYYQIYLYDLCDRVTQVVTSTNAYTVSYDEKGIDLSTFSDNHFSYNDDVYVYNLRRQDNVYDALGHLQAQSKDVTTNSRDKKVKRIQQTNDLDRWGNALSHTSANHYTTFYEYNAFDEVTKQILPKVRVVNEHGIASIITPELHYAYDALGRLIAMTDANNHTNAKVLDAEGKVIQDIDGLGHHRDKNYDLLGQLTSITSQRNNISSVINYTYDKANRLLSVGTPKSMQHYTYDEAGQLIKQSNGLSAQANIIRFEYDELGHQVEREERGHKTAFVFDDEGHKILEKNAKGNTKTWKYDKGRMVEHTDLGGHKTVYTYNTNGLMLSELSSSTKKYKVFHYFSDGLLEEYNDIARGETIDFNYDDEGNVIKKESSTRGQWTAEIDYYTYDSLGRLEKVRRRNPDDTSKDEPNDNKAILSIDYEYDAVGNIRDTKVMARYPKRPATYQTNYYKYDENNRIILSKGLLQNGAIVMTATQGSELSYDEVGNINAAKKFEGGAVHQYSYLYNSDNLINVIKKDGHNLQTKEYDDTGNVISEHRYNTLGVLTQNNTMTYKSGLLSSVKTTNASGQEISLSTYAYDVVENLETLTSLVRAQGKSAAYKQTHTYKYELWDTYQQNLDIATLVVSGNTTVNGSSRRIYDINGQIAASVDNLTKDTTWYSNSSLEGLRGRIDKNNQTSYLTVAGKTIGDLRLDKNGASHLEVYGGFTPGGGAVGPAALTPRAMKFVPETVYEEMDAALTKPEEVAPEVPQDSLGTYTLQAGDTLESIALQVYGDASLWYLIADANGITNFKDRAGEKGSQMHLGQRLNIPAAAQNQHYTNATHKVLNSFDMIGNTSASTPLPPPPPVMQKRKSPWRIIGLVAVAVIATVATVVTAGAIGIALGAVSSGGLGGLIGLGTTILGGGGGIMLGGSTILGSIGAGFAAGFVGSIAGQGAAAAFGMQNGIDIQGALITGLATAATAGVGNALSGSATYQKVVDTMDNHSFKTFNIKSATEMMERDALSQGINMGAHKQQHLDWIELGISTATAGFINSETGNHMNEKIGQTFKEAAPTITSELQALLTGALTSAATGTEFNAGQVLKEHLGDSIANNVVQSISKTGTEVVKESAIEAAKRALEEDEQKQALKELMEESKQTKAEQEKGAWSDESHNELSFDSSLINSEGENLTLAMDFTPTLEDSYLLWKVKNSLGADYKNDPIIGLDALGLSLHDKYVIYQESPFTFEEALSKQMNLKEAPPQQWVGGHGTNLWENATRKQVRDSMNVEKLFSDPVKRLQFMDLHYVKGLNSNDLNVLLKGKGVLEGKGSSFLKASKENNINPIYLISHALLESKNGSSLLAKKNNFFGLGALDGRAYTSGSKFAEKHGWTTPELGILGGAKIISQKWINGSSKSQTTLYNMRWNPMNPGHNPQYATDIGWANEQTKIIHPQLVNIQKINHYYKPIYLVPQYRK